MASLIVAGDTSGSVTIAAPAIASTPTLTLPTVSGTFITTGSTGQVIPKAALPTGSVLQVVSATKTDTFTTTSTSWTDVTGLSVSITPSSSSSRILVFFSVMTGETTNQFPFLRLVRNSTTICVGDAAGSRTQTTSVSWSNGANNTQSMQSMNFLDSPATTSATTYKLQTLATAGETILINRNARDSNVSGEPRGVSTITVMEIAA